MKRALALFGIWLLVLIAAPAAAGGNWATVRLSSLSGELRAGDSWNLTIKVLQHGNHETPVLGANPRVTLENAETGSRIVYTAEPTDDPGSYRFEAVFPEAGEWAYSIYDGFDEYGGAQTHTYAPVTIEPSSRVVDTPLSAPAPALGTAGGPPLWPIVLGTTTLLTGVALGRLPRSQTGAGQCPVDGRVLEGDRRRRAVGRSARPAGGARGRVGRRHSEVRASSGHSGKYAPAWPVKTERAKVAGRPHTQAVCGRPRTPACDSLQPARWCAYLPERPLVRRPEAGRCERPDPAHPAPVPRPPRSEASRDR